MPKTLRGCIIAEKGYTFIAIDASQIELREIAYQSQDPAMLEDLQTGDLHMGTAIRMFGWTDDEAEMKKRRYDAKQGNFAEVYGADEYKLSQMLECSVEEAQDFMAERRRTYPRLYEWIEEVKTQAKEDGFVVNKYGRIRLLPDLKAGSWKVRQKAERECVNTIIQGSAVDTVKLMMLENRAILSHDVRLVLQVHDEWVWECPDLRLADAIRLSKVVLDTQFPEYPVSIEIGKCYGEKIKEGG